MQLNSQIDTDKDTQTHTKVNYKLHL